MRKKKIVNTAKTQDPESRWSQLHTI